MANVNGIVKIITKVGKVVGSTVAIAAVTELGYLGGRMLIQDGEYTAKYIDSKVNPKVMKKRHWYSKAELFNTRTNTFVADKKAKKTK